MNRAAFFNTVRARLGRLSQLQVQGFEAVLDAIASAPLSHQAYMLATCWHETAATMQPVREAFNLSEGWRKRNLRYYPYYGRGFVQLTWDYNYRKADDECAAAGLTEPGAIMADLDLAMRPDVAAFILRKGMDEGWFTGKRNLSYLPASGVATRDQYMKARRIINGNDKADLIEGYAQVFERALKDGGLT